MYDQNAQHPTNEREMGSTSGQDPSAAEENDQLKHQIGSDFLIVNLLRTKNKAKVTTTNEIRNTRTLKCSTDRNIKKDLGHPETKFTETTNVEKGILGAESPVVYRTFSDQSDQKVEIGQNDVSEKSAWFHAISSGPGNNLVNFSSDESRTNRTGLRPFLCFECAASFTSDIHLQQHRKKHDREKQSAVPTSLQSGLSFPSHSLFDMEGNSSSDHKATKNANQSYRNPLELKPSNSVLGIQKQAEKVRKWYECEFCHKTFMYRCTLYRHRRIHTREKSYECNVCDKKFSRKDLLSQHLRIHTGDKPFKCSVCNFIFTRKGSLTRHMVIHSREKFV